MVPATQRIVNALFDKLFGHRTRVRDYLGFLTPLPRAVTDPGQGASSKPRHIRRVTIHTAIESAVFCRSMITDTVISVGIWIRAPPRTRARGSDAPRGGENQRKMVQVIGPHWQTSRPGNRFLIWPLELDILRGRSSCFEHETLGRGAQVLLRRHRRSRAGGEEQLDFLGGRARP